jgi:hypothetical protein
MAYLIFVNGLGPNYRGDNMYEFIFSESIEDIWDDTWESKPANGYPKPPKIDYIKKVGVLKNTSIEFELIQNSDFFSFIDALDGIIALAWEKESDDKDFSVIKRLVFKFGETEEEIKNKLYERDFVLEYEKKVVYEN